MVMMPCPDCKKIISGNAEKCPKCGRALTSVDVEQWRANSAKSKKASRKIGIVLIVAVIIYSVISSFITRQQNDITSGKILSITDGRNANGTVSVRIKAADHLTNKLIIDGNYQNAVDLITKKGYDNCELRYYAVMDRTDGKEGKIMSFTVSAIIVSKVASGDIGATQLPNYVTDLWIHPQFK